MITRMQGVPEPPILVLESGDLVVFATLKDALGWMEAIDVLDGIFQVLDSRGRLVEVTAESDKSRVIAVGLTDDPTPERSREAIERFARSLRPDDLGLSSEQIASLPIRELAERILQAK
jgi:hypothetical protein